MRLYNLSYGIFYLLIMACSQQAQPEYQAIDFTVNEAVLGTSYLSESIPFNLRYPMDVQAVDSTDFLTIRESVNSDTNAYFMMKLLDIKRSTSGSVVTISIIDRLEEKSKILDDQYMEQLKTTFNTNSVIRNKVLINNIPSIQFIVTAEDYINIKLFLLFEPNIFQIDYFIPSGQYYELLEQVESSIGSISLKNNKEKK